MPSSIDIWIIEWRKYEGDEQDARLYGYSAHAGTNIARAYLTHLYERIAKGGEIGLEGAFPGLGWGSVVEATHAKVDRDSELGKLLIEEKSVRTHANSKELNHFQSEIEALALAPDSASLYIADYIPLADAIRITRLRRQRARGCEL